MGAFTSTSRSLLLLQLFISTSNALLPALPTVTQRPSLLERRSNEIQQRAISTELSTCGYLNGDPGKERTADPGFNCRIDTRNGIWGFCPTSVIVATDCGLAGSCVDKYECAEGCGITDKKDLTTFTCSTNSFCSMALLTFGVDQTYSYVACGPKATTDHYYITPTIKAETTSSESTESTTVSEPSETATLTSETSTSTTDDASNTTEFEKSTTSTSTFSSQPTADELSQERPSSSDDSPSILGPIIGGVLGGLVMICGTAIAVIYLLRRNRGKGSDTEPQEKNSPPDSWAYYETKQPQQLGGWGPQELPGNANYQNAHYGRQHAVELAS